MYIYIYIHIYIYIYRTPKFDEPLVLLLSLLSIASNNSFCIAIINSY